MKFEKQKMVGWYDAVQLFNTALKTVISSTLGNYADRRELQAAVNPELDYYDLSQHFGDEAWVDYVSDLGDGFNATYSVAHLLGKPELIIGNLELKRGDILVMGGDMVYPTPEIDQYNNRLKGPYKAAFPDPDDENYWIKDKINPKRRVKNTAREFLDPIERPPFLFAIPGNHDWYDGLSNFLKIFTQNRRFGNWQTLQKRSYFAIKLCHDVWLWGIDVQLHSDIDQPQKEYFMKLACNIMPNGSKIILCTAEPAWVYPAVENNIQSYNRLKYFIKNFIFNEFGMLDDKKLKTKKKHDLIATLTGDLHHYSHYCEEKDGRQFNHCITAGGGGAFLHPTHGLPEKITELTQENFVLKNRFPDKDESLKLLKNNFGFPVYSPQFSVIMAVVYLFFAWFMWKNTAMGHRIGLIDDPKNANFFNSFSSSLKDMSLVILGTVFLIYKFTDVKSAKKKLAVQILGFGHGLVHILALFVITWFLAKSLRAEYWPFIEKSSDPTGLYREMSFYFILQIAVFGGLIGTFIMGAYLYVANRFFNIHITESFSGLAIEDYKNFLRINVQKGKVTIYPIGIRKINKRWRNYNTDDFPLFKGKKIPIHIIGKKPIEINIEQVIEITASSKK